MISSIKTRRGSVISVELPIGGVLGGGGGFNDLCNLEVGDCLCGRTSRGGVIAWDRVPDQVLDCGGRQYHRFGNNLKRVAYDTGERDYDLIVSLHPYGEDKNRFIFQWQDKICVLPDAIAFGGREVWLPFGADCSVQAALPFLDAKTLFFPSGYFGEEVCNDYSKLSVGSQLYAHWLSEIFTVIAREDKNVVAEDGSIVNEGTLIILDKELSGYDRLPDGATVSYCNPVNGRLLFPYVIGANSVVRLEANEMSFFGAGNNYVYYPERQLKVGQRVRLGGFSNAENNKTAIITGLDNGRITFDRDFYSELSEGAEITVTPLIPEFECMIFTEDRLFGADNNTGRFYVSELNNPLMLYDTPTDEASAWSVPLDAHAVAMTLWRDNVICFTDEGGFRVLGYHGLNFGIRQLSVSGILRGCGASLVRVGDNLYYTSAAGVMRYSGGKDHNISYQLPRHITPTSSATDNRLIYLHYEDRVWVYDPNNKRWWSEDFDGSYIHGFEGRVQYYYPDFLLEKNAARADTDFYLQTADTVSISKSLCPISANLLIEGQAECELVQLNDGSMGRTLPFRVTGGQCKLISLSLERVVCNRLALLLRGNGIIKIRGISLSYREF